MQRKNSRMTGVALEEFMARWGLTRGQTAKSLGISERMIYLYLDGTHAVPRTIALLIKALDENWRNRPQP